MNSELKIVVLAGGNGTRLWPISRETYPKQFNKLDSLDGESLFQISLKRAKFLTKTENIYIVVSEDNAIHARKQATESEIKIKEENYIFQPSMKETLPIIALATSKIKEGNILFLTSDHVIEDLPEFKTKIELAADNSDKGIVIFGVEPTRPETGFGYIEKENKGETFSKVSKFYEKPNFERAKEYIKDGFVWNSGMFLFNRKKFEELLNKANPIMKELIFDTDISDIEKFNQVEAISIDNGLIEKIAEVYCVGLTNYWTDLGTFDSISDYNSEKNIKTKDIISEGVNKNNLIINTNSDKKICLIDIEDLIIVDTGDVLLISKKGSSNKVKNIVKQVNKLNII